MTLLDSSTNRSYQNVIFPIKRNRIIDLDKTATFVPVCTKNAFLKYYSDRVDNMIFWHSQDSENHQRAMAERLMAIENPEVIRYCSNRLVHKKDNLIYLLSKSTFCGYHAELRTLIFEKNLSKMSKKGELPDEISDFCYEEVYGSEESAYARIELNNKDIYNVYYEDDGFSALDDEEEASELVLPEVLGNLPRKMFPGETVN